jgi:hypothetical protein
LGQVVYSMIRWLNTPPDPNAGFNAAVNFAWSLWSRWN